ncbi:MAG: hypothetical protein NW223_00160 [Hyphomicrobiaceae bacterium]|nr:hypothetical protein [Hyphomicrobiaceae bacterium]
MLGARIFVGSLYTLLGISFLLSTGFLLHDYREADWVSMLTTHSNLFLFFPVLGILALVAFFVPSVVFTHLYWNHLPLGRLRFIFGTICAVAISLAVDRYLDVSPRALWEIAPQVLAADKGVPAGCKGEACERASATQVLRSLREAAQVRVGISKFARACGEDKLLEPRADMKPLRFCFPAQKNLDGYACCRVQAEFTKAVDAMHANPANRSLTARWDRLFMPMKIFFVVVVLAIGALLAVWRDKVDEFYGPYVPAIERGVIIGGFAMLVWPVMDYAYLSAANVMFGHEGSGPQFKLSLVIAPWMLLLIFYFLRRLGQEGEMMGQISGVVAAAVAVLRYEELNDWGSRLFGVGMPDWMLGLLLAIAIGGLISLFWRWRVVNYPKEWSS